MKENVKPTPAYDSSLVRQDECARYMEEIHEMAVKGESLHAAMGTLLPLPKWEDILLLGAQLDPAPLNDDDPVSTQTIIERDQNGSRDGFSQSTDCYVQRRGRHPAGRKNGCL